MKKGIINTSIFLFFVIITFYVIFKDNNITEILQIIKQVDKKFILMAIGCMFCFVLSEGINIMRTLKLLDCKVSLKKGWKYALVGFFFSSVTPSASGGDPMQLYYMKKDGLPVGSSALAILTEFSSFQFITVMIAVIGFITNYEWIYTSIGDIKYLLILGVLINMGILVIVLLMIFSNQIINKMIYFICKILKKFHYKEVESFKMKCLEQVQEYKLGSQLLRHHPKVLLKILGTTILQVVLFHSIPYFIYLAFGLTGEAFSHFLVLQSVLYIAVSSLPLPGAVGVSEGGFLGVYRILFPAGLLNSAMLLSRGISFYLFVVISGGFVLCFSLRKKEASN